MEVQSSQGLLHELDHMPMQSLLQHAMRQLDRHLKLHLKMR